VRGTDSSYKVDKTQCKHFRMQRLSLQSLKAHKASMLKSSFDSLSVSGAQQLFTSPGKVGCHKRSRVPPLRVRSITRLGNQRRPHSSLCYLRPSSLLSYFPPTMPSPHSPATSSRPLTYLQLPYRYLHPCAQGDERGCTTTATK
jgi:hypothetical protein